MPGYNFILDSLNREKYKRKDHLHTFTVLIYYHCKLHDL
jgi:hypothetical protein